MSYYVVLDDTCQTNKKKGDSVLDDVMEYVFFDLSLAERFREYCSSLGLKVVVNSAESDSEEPTFTVIFSDNIEFKLVEQIESIYCDLLFGEQAALVEGNNEGGAVADHCGVQVRLQSGSFTTIAVQPDIMNKLLSVLSTEELQFFLAGVVEDVENPKEGPVCSRVEQGTI